MKYFLFTILLFHFSQIHGQEKFEPQTTIGVTQKLNIPLVYFDPIITQTAKFAYHGGFVFRHISQPGLGLQMELNFSQRGWKGSVPDSIFLDRIFSFANYSRNLTYIEFPLMTNITFGKKNTKFLINAGIMLSALISDQLKINLSEKKQALYDQLHQEPNGRLDFGICLGAGLSRKTKIGIFQFEARYNQSLTNIFSNTPDDVFSHSKAIVIGTGITYLFELKK